MVTPNNDNSWVGFPTFILVAILLFIYLYTAYSLERQHNPTWVVEKYIKAKATADSTIVQRYICSDMKKYTLQEANAYVKLEDVKVVDLACQQVGTSMKVKCSGKIIGQIDNEVSEFPLSTYRVIMENNAWKWCGEMQ